VEFQDSMLGPQDLRLDQLARFGDREAARLTMAADPKALAALDAPFDFEALLERVHDIGREVIAPAAARSTATRASQGGVRGAEAGEASLGVRAGLDYGGLGWKSARSRGLCEALGRYCASTAMVFAMHQIQVACVVHHALGTAFFRDYVRELAKHQYLLASATTSSASAATCARASAP
jgi:alkylation response protein AidB-like acyl-CoA dehydrogenase